MDEKQLVQSLLRINNVSHRLNMELDGLAADAELLSNYVCELFETLNPIKFDVNNEQWDDYIKATLIYIERVDK